MREVRCACGESFAGSDDDELFPLIRAHADSVHSELKMTDEQIRALLAANARDRS